MFLQIQGIQKSFGAGDSRVDVLKAVSYTHLDVYKRQRGDSLF